MGIKEVDDGIWLVSFMDYDLGYIDLEEKNSATLKQPFWPKDVNYVFGTFCKGSLRTVHSIRGLQFLLGGHLLGLPPIVRDRLGRGKLGHTP